MEYADIYLLAVISVFVVILAIVLIKKLNELHATMNSRLDELLQVTSKLARAEGFKAGQENHLGNLKDAASRLK